MTRLPIGGLCSEQKSRRPDARAGDQSVRHDPLAPTVCSSRPHRLGIADIASISPPSDVPHHDVVARLAQSPITARPIPDRSSGHDRITGCPINSLPTPSGAVIDRHLHTTCRPGGHLDATHPVVETETGQPGQRHSTSRCSDSRKKPSRPVAVHRRRGPPSKITSSTIPCPGSRVAEEHRTQFVGARRRRASASRR